MTTPKPIDPRNVFLKGKEVILKVLTREDVLESNWYGWFNDEELCRTLQKHYYPNTVEAQLQFWEKNILNATNKIQLGVCRVDAADLLGVVSLNNIDFVNRKAEFSAVIGEKEGRIVSLYIESCRLMFNHAFNSLNLHRIYGGSMSKELVELMCRTFGCVKEGLAREDIFKDGKYQDAHLYGLLKSDFDDSQKHGRESKA